VYDWEQVRHLGLAHQLLHPVLGQIAVPGGPIRYDGVPAAATMQPPLLGEHEDQLENPWLDQQEGTR
jgi:crotonobetainyl-CoA:carnitine CoA-transferase CaiB-like acyl-CoA transferase